LHTFPSRVTPADKDGAFRPFVGGLTPQSHQIIFWPSLRLSPTLPLFGSYLFGDKYLFSILSNQQRARSDFLFDFVCGQLWSCGRVHHAEVKEICARLLVAESERRVALALLKYVHVGCKVAHVFGSAVIVACCDRSPADAFLSPPPSQRTYEIPLNRRVGHLLRTNKTSLRLGPPSFLPSSLPRTSLSPLFFFLAGFFFTTRKKKKKAICAERKTRICCCRHLETVPCAAEAPDGRRM
jgi:hypothetical protein